MTDQPQPGTVPPAFTPPPNGHGPTARLIEALPQMLYGAFSAALRQEAPAPLRCYQCAMDRMAWGQRHAAAFTAAEQAYKDAVAAMMARPPEDRAPLDAQDFIPPYLRPGGARTPRRPSRPGPSWRAARCTATSTSPERRGRRGRRGGPRC